MRTRFVGWSLPLCLAGYRCPLVHAEVTALDKGLIAWWRMDERGGNQITDASGNGHHLTITGSPTFVADAVVFDGDGILIAPAADDLGLSGDWTISLRVREDNGQAGNSWVAKYRAYGQTGWALVSDSWLARVALMNAPNCAHDTSEPLPLQSWTRLTATFDSQTEIVRIYFGPTLKAESITPCNMQGNSDPVVVGGLQESDGSFTAACRGAAADIRIYGRALTPEEVAELAAIGNDSDGDGVADADDDCPDSDLEETVVIGECDSSVTNFLFDDGCSMMDEIGQCAAEAGNHGQFVRCVAGLLGEWRAAGLITSREAAAIARCAAWDRPAAKSAAKDLAPTNDPR